METPSLHHHAAKLLTIAALVLLVSPAWGAKNTLPKSRPAMTPAELAKQSSTRTLGYRACSFCFTCGGPWPYLAGTFYTPVPEDTVERGSSCSGGLAYRSDTNPRLCCGVDQ